MHRPWLHLAAYALCLGAAVLAFAAAAQAPAKASSVAAATADAAAAPVIARPAPDARIERVLTAMNNASTWGHPDLFGEYAGMRLYSEGHYKSAIKYFKYGARYADKLSQLSIGLMYENGQGVARDPVTACAWLALASERKYQSFVATRDRVCKALTPKQHDEAVAVLDKLMPEYGDAVAKPRMAHELELAKMQGTGSRLGYDSGIYTTGVKQNCGGPVLEGTPVAGCGSTDFWSPWRWDPKKYFAARDAQWRGVVSVGGMEDLKKQTPAGADAQRAPAGSAPAPAASSGH